MTPLLDQSTTSPPAPATASARRRGRYGPRVLAWTVGVAAAVLLAAALWWRPAGAEPLPLTAAVQRGTLRVTVTERGSLESAQQVEGFNELEGFDAKIVWLIDEGSVVAAGAEVVKLDTAEIDKAVREQRIKVNQADVKGNTTEQEIEIARNKGDSEIAAAELEHTLAGLELEKWTKGEFLTEKADLQGKEQLAKKNLGRAEEMLVHMRGQVRKGFKSRSQLESYEEELKEAQFNHQRDTEALRVLLEFENRRKTTELEAKVVEAANKIGRATASAAAELAKARSEHDTAVATLKLEQDRLADLERQLTRCVLTAAEAGIVAYANDRWWDESSRIREGATVYPRQKIFSLPDMSRMQASVNVHESLVQQVKVGQSASVRVDAHAGAPLIGKVESVATLADSTSSFMQNGVKEYKVVVTLTDLPELDFKPGMTAEVTILTAVHGDVLTVPVQAVAQRQRTHYAYVVAGGRLARTEVEVGADNRRRIRILEGLSEGAEVALTARTLLLDDLGTEQPAGQAGTAP